MAVTTATVLAAISAGSSLIGGLQQRAAGKEQAAMAMASAEMQGKEQARVSAAQALQEKKAAESAAREQKIRFLKSGVGLEGSPFLALEETRLQGERNVNEIISSGGSAVASTMAEGRTRAASLKNQGRAAFMSGLSSAAGTLSNVNWKG